MIGDAGPVLVLTKDTANLFEAQLGEHAPHKHFFVWLRNIVQDLLNSLNFLFADQLLRKSRRGIRKVLQNIKVRLLNLSGLFDMGIVAVLGNLAKPDTHVTVAPEAIYGMHCLEECFAGDLFGYMIIAGKTPDVQIHIIEVCIVQLLEIRHAITSFTYKTSKEEKSYKLFSIIAYILQKTKQGHRRSDAHHL